MQGARVPSLVRELDPTHNKDGRSQMLHLIPGTAKCINKYEKRKYQVFYASWIKWREELEDFPGGPVVKKPLASGGDMGLGPGQGRFHMPQGN